MDEANKTLFNILCIVGPTVFFIVIFPVLVFFTDLGIILSLVIAMLIALVDFVMLTWLLRRVAK